MEQELERLRQEAREIRNTTEHFIKSAKAYLEKGNAESARACLILLCERCSNYEESIEFNELTEEWQAMRYLVDGLVEPSVPFNFVKARSPEDCTVPIKEILVLEEEDLLSSLSEHLSELSANGELLNCLNKWERIVFYIDELWSEVNSGGFDSYLYYHGLHFEKAYNALKTVSAVEVMKLLDDIREKFPRKRIPTNEVRLQDTMDAMEEAGVDFEQEDELFYSIGETELSTCLLSYVKEHHNRFR